MSPSHPPDSYCTLGGVGDAEIKIQRSRFVAWAGPAPDEDAARAFIADLARRYHDSRHVCFAWRLGRTGSPTENRNDDGEPSGTAGEPILAAIRRRDVTDVVAVVVRYFGGVKLGTGGLQRAYGEAADLALAAAPLREVLLGRTFRLALPYPFQKTARHLLENSRGRIQDEEYSDRVVWKVWLPHSTWEACQAALTEASAAAVKLEPLEGDPGT
jgi:uncharacterized YigZ family protein